MRRRAAESEPPAHGLRGHDNNNNNNNNNNNHNNNNHNHSRAQGEGGAEVGGGKENLKSGPKYSMLGSAPLLVTLYSAGAG